MNPSTSPDAVSHAALLLLAQPSAAPSPLERWADVAADVATIVIALAIIVAGLVILWAALRFRKMMRQLRMDFDPAVRNANALSENVRALSERVRTNVEELSETVRETNEKVRRATEAAEVRLGELNALAGVVQREAEDTFVRAAGAVRGVQAGTRALRRLVHRGGDEAYDDEGYDGGMDEVLDDEGMDEVDEGEARPARARRTGRDIFD